MTKGKTICPPPLCGGGIKSIDKTHQFSFLFHKRLKVYISFEDHGFCRSFEISDENLIGKKNGQVNRRIDRSRPVLFPAT